MLLREYGRVVERLRVNLDRQICARRPRHPECRLEAGEKRPRDRISTGEDGLLDSAKPRRETANTVAGPDHPVPDPVHAISIQRAEERQSVARILDALPVVEEELWLLKLQESLHWPLLHPHRWFRTPQFSLGHRRQQDSRTARVAQ